MLGRVLTKQSINLNFTKMIGKIALIALLNGALAMQNENDQRFLDYLAEHGKSYPDEHEF